MYNIASKYAQYLDNNELTPVLGLGEGETPLVRSVFIGNELGYNVNLFFKLENQNPSFSFKDRGVVYAIAKAAERKKCGIICATAGNLGISAAMYSARAGMTCVVLIPKLLTNDEKIKRMELYGARVRIIDGTLNECLKLCEEVGETYGYEVLNYSNPDYLRGLNTISYEIADSLGKGPDIFSCGIGHGSLFGAAWNGFKEYYSAFKLEKLPVMFGFKGITGKNAGSSIMLSEINIIRDNDEIYDKALIARDESNGYIADVSDEQAAAVYRKLAAKESIIADISSCASAAGLYKLKADGVDFDNQTIVCVLSGFSDSTETVYINSSLNSLKLFKPTINDLESELVI